MDVILMTWKFVFSLVVMMVWFGILPTTDAVPTLGGGGSGDGGGGTSGGGGGAAEPSAAGGGGSTPPVPPPPQAAPPQAAPPQAEPPQAEEPHSPTHIGAEGDRQHEEVAADDRQGSDHQLPPPDVAVAPSEVSPPKVVLEPPKRTFWHGIVRRFLNMNCFFWRYMPPINPFAYETREMVKTWVLFHGYVPQCLKYILEAEYTIADENLLKFLKFSKVPIVWVLGPPGSGKGTVCERFAKEESYTHISVGQLIRDELKVAKPKTAKLIEVTIDHGDLLPGDFVVTLLVNKMLATYTKTRGFLVDGFPRAESQAVLFREMVNTPDLIMVLEARENILLQRILARDEGRGDDNEETFKHRFKVYNSQIDGIKKNRHFKRKIDTVNAEVSKEECYQDFANSIRSTTKIERTKRSQVNVHITQEKQEEKKKEGKGGAKKS